MRYVVYFIVLSILWVIVRPWLRTKPWMSWFFDTVEPIERWLWLKSESIFLARALQLAGAALLFLANFDTSSLDTLMLLAPMLPEAWQGHAQTIVRLMPLLVNGAGFLLEYQRRDVTKPLTVVAIAPDAPIEARAMAAQISAEAKKADEFLRKKGQGV